MQEDLVRIEPCTTVDQVFDTLAKFATAAAEGGNAPHPSVLFRGHLHTHYRLISRFHRQIILPPPSRTRAYQEELDFFIKHGMLPADVAAKQPHEWPTHHRRSWAEYAAMLMQEQLRLFAMHAISARQLVGVAAAEASAALNRKGSQNARIDLCRCAAVVGLAQHHEIPTPLLDWTADYNVALWFVVSDEYASRCPWISASAQVPDATSMSEIWGIPRALFEHSSVRLQEMVDQTYPTAQGGLFTFDPEFERDFKENGEIVALDDRLKRDHDLFAFTRIDDRPFRVQFPTHLVPKLRRRLQGMGHSTARLKPSLDNIAKFVQNDDMP